MTFTSGCKSPFDELKYFDSTNWSYLAEPCLGGRHRPHQYIQIKKPKLINLRNALRDGGIEIVKIA
ncbi:hypothetical protein YK48G_22700 [Lentilactobacillus fungorum]|uniref:Uncharacterized protein n=1 Tax=Lentilactobacillus fungorum TaxID=2201250 RepID=A0ABQ3W103_9LACO|nr:hypothetical protein YK48G_22700 [Lentilactobacillus fungorum]